MLMRTVCGSSRIYPSPPKPGPMSFQLSYNRCPMTSTSFHLPRSVSFLVLFSDSWELLKSTSFQLSMNLFKFTSTSLFMSNTNKKIKDKGDHVLLPQTEVLSQTVPNFFSLCE
jgi:hypothetical protein